MNYNYANVLNKNGQPEEAIKFYKKSINLNTNYLNSYNNIANIYLENKMYFETSEMLKEIKNKDNNNFGAIVSYNFFCKMNLADWNNLFKLDNFKDNLINSIKFLLPYISSINIKIFSNCFKIIFQKNGKK